MRILHVPYSFPPDPAGGTEIYVASLAAEQRALGCEAAVAAPAERSGYYMYAGFPVWRFAVDPNLRLDDLYGAGDARAAETFGGILDEFRPALVHLHALTSAVSIRLADEATRRRIPIVFNYHTPNVSCGRATLLRWGYENCDGRLDATRCAECIIQGRGVPRPLASVLGRIPRAFGHMLGESNLDGGVWTALRMKDLTFRRIEAFHRMMEASGRIIALCEWTRTLLLSNGVPESRIRLCRQGILWDGGAIRRNRRSRENQTVRLCFLGRIDPTKGAQVLLEALRLDHNLPVEVDIYGVSQSEAGARHFAELRRIAAGDERVRFLAALPSDQVIGALADYDALVVPSQWPETGPLVVLEAFAAGVPVIGSHFGGIPELVADGKDGLLVRQYASPSAWLETLRRIAAEPALLTKLRAGIRPPRRTIEAAQDFLVIYQELLRSAAGSPERSGSQAVQA